MTGFQIREKIDKNNAAISQSFRPNTFVLDTNIARLVEENKKLQQQCIHKFENGLCIYCDFKEEEQ